MGRHEQKQARRLRRRQLAAEAEMVVEREGRELMNEAEMENVGGEMAVGEDIDGVDEMVWGEEDNIFVMEEDSSDDLEVHTIHSGTLLVTVTVRVRVKKKWLLSDLVVD